MIRILGNSTRKSDINFYRNGRIDITARLGKILSIKQGDVIDLLTDKGEYYIYVRHRSKDIGLGRYEGQCCPTSKAKKCHNFRAYSKKLCDAMLSLYPDKEYRVRLPIGEVVDDPAYGKCVTIIHLNNLQNENRG